MKRATILFALTLFTSIILAQSTENIVKKNAVHLDLGGWSFWYSLNYEHRISLAENHRLALGGGISVLPPGKEPNVLLGVSSNYLYGKTHNLEIGFTPSYLVSLKEFYFSPRIGYRYEAPKGFLFRVGTSPSFTSADTSGLIMLSWGYLSFGYTF